MSEIKSFKEFPSEAKKIDRFREDYFFLSNMYPLPNPIPTDIGLATTTEHAYQAAKFSSGSGFRQAILAAQDGFAAKRLARKVQKRQPDAVMPGWPSLKIPLMRSLQVLKFAYNPELCDMLAATGSADIIEGNEWGDRFWGVSLIGSGIGQNILGNILTSVRNQLQKDPSPIMRTALSGEISLGDPLLESVAAIGASALSGYPLPVATENSVRAVLPTPPPELHQ